MDNAQFYGVRAAAANLSASTAPYTKDMFLADFPQFTSDGTKSIAPDAMLDMFVKLACSAISPEKWPDNWRYACGLYTAHNLTLYLRTYAAQSASPAQAAASGATVGVLKSATLGDSSVTYDTEALTKATEKWGGLNATQYGQTLATMARLVGMGGMTVI